MVHFTPEEITNIILHVILIACFICVFFFLYAVKIEEKIVEEQVDYIVTDFVSNLSILDDTSKQKLKQYVDSIKIPNLQEEDKQINDKNLDLRNYVLKIAGITIVVGLCFVYWMSVRYNFNVKELFIQNAIIILFVGLTEYCFLTYLASNFKSGDPNFVKRILVQSLQEISQ